MINRGECPIKGKEPYLAEMLKRLVLEKKLSATQDFSTCKDSHAILIAVQTPFDTQRMEPKYVSLESASALFRSFSFSPISKDLA